MSANTGTSRGRKAPTEVVGWWGGTVAAAREAWTAEASTVPAGAGAGGFQPEGWASLQERASVSVSGSHGATSDRDEERRQAECAR